MDGIECEYFDELFISVFLFDLVLVFLNCFGVDFIVEDLSKEEERLFEFVERVSTELNREIMVYGEDFEKGIENIVEIYNVF